MFDHSENVGRWKEWKWKNEKTCALDRERTKALSTALLLKKLNVYNCKGDKSVPPHAD